MERKGNGARTRGGEGNEWNGADKRCDVMKEVFIDVRLRVVARTRAFVERSHNFTCRISPPPLALSLACGRVGRRTAFLTWVVDCI
jgi:hypothetical protein